MIDDLKPYPAYKDSGVEWLGEVPKGWEVLLSRRFCRVFAGATPDRDEPSYWNEGTLPWLASGDVNQRRICSASQFITDAGFKASSTKWIRPGSLVIALAGQGKTKGMAALVEIAATCNQSLGVLEPSSVCNPEFLLYYFESRYRDIRGLVGDLRDGLNLEHLKQLPTPIPPLAEQVAIARFLHHIDLRIQQLISIKERSIELLGEEKQAIIRRAVTCGLDRDVSLKPSGIDWLGDVPEHWEVVPLKMLTSAVVNGSTPPPSDPSYYEGGSVPWFGPSSLASEDCPGPPSRFITESTFAVGKARRVTAPALLVTVIGSTAGRMGLLMEDGATNQQITAFTLRDRLIEPEILVTQLRFASRWLRGTASTATMPILDSALLKRLPVAIPERSEQQSLVRFVADVRASATRAIEREKSHITLLHEYRTRLIADVVTGKLDVREAAERLPDDPDADDPALEEGLEEVAAR